MNKQPGTPYQTMLGRLMNVSKKEDIIEVAKQLMSLNPDIKKTRHDIMLVIYDKYQLEKKRVGDNDFASRNIKIKFDDLSKTLFGGGINRLVLYVEENSSDQPRVTFND